MDLTKFNHALSNILRRLPFKDEETFLTSAHEIINDILDAVGIPTYGSNMGSIVSGQDGTYSIVFNKTFSRYLKNDGHLSVYEKVINNKLSEIHFPEGATDKEITEEISSIIKSTILGMGYNQYDGEIGSILKKEGKVIDVGLSPKLLEFLDDSNNRTPINHVCNPYKS